jgi:hypothetical protein
MTTSENLAEKVDTLTTQNKKLTDQLRAALSQLMQAPIAPSAVAVDINRQALESEYRECMELIRHIWLHSNYKFCGYWQMTSEQQEMFRVITGTKPEVFAVVQ